MENETKRMYLTELERDCLFTIIDQCLDKLKVDKSEEITTIGTLWNLKTKLKKLKYNA